VVTTEIEKAFPGLCKTGYEITSSRDRGYNCISWAAGDDERWWWPAAFPFAYWPEGAAAEETLEAFIQAFSTLGYECCDTDAYEAGYERIALYVDSHGHPTHGARQLEDGRWSSKLGKLEDITHTLEGLQGALYGAVAQVMRRTKTID
jgi:hypothetical protein